MAGVRVRLVQVLWGGASPLAQEGAARVLDILQLQETGTNQKRLHVLLVDGHVTVISEVNQGLKCTERGNNQCLSEWSLFLQFLFK